MSARPSRCRLWHVSRRLCPRLCLLMGLFRRRHRSLHRRRPHCSHHACPYGRHQRRHSCHRTRRHKRCRRRSRCIVRLSARRARSLLPRRVSERCLPAWGGSALPRLRHQHGWCHRPLPEERWQLLPSPHHTRTSNRSMWTCPPERCRTAVAAALLAASRPFEPKWAPRPPRRWQRDSSQGVPACSPACHPPWQPPATDGYADGYAKSDTGGDTDARKDGYTGGFMNGYTDGYEDGYADGRRR